MIDSTGVLDWAIPLWLPSDKRYGTNRNENAVMHSLEANYQGRHGLSQNIRDMATHWPDLGSKDRSTVIAALDDLYWAWRDTRREWTAWHTTTFKEGFVVQHAPLHWMIAHGHDCNDDATGHEAEGRAPEPLTGPQVKAYDRILDDLAEWKGHPFTRENGHVWEHKQCPRAATACPGGRYAPLYAHLKSQPDDDGDDEMTPQERELLYSLARVTAGWGQVDEISNPDAMTARIAELDDRNINLLLSIQRKNAAIMRVQEALEDLTDTLGGNGTIEDSDAQAMGQHLRALASLIEGNDSTDPLAEDQA